MTITVKDMQRQSFLKKLDSEGRVKAIACPTDFQVGSSANASDLTVRGNATVRGNTTLQKDSHAQAALTVEGNCYLSGTLHASSSQLIQPSWTAVSAYGTGNTYDFTQYWHQHPTSTWSVTSFMEDSLGFVHLKGLCQNNNDSASQIIFTLPTTHRPADGKDHICTAWSSDSSAGTQQACRVVVTSAGVVQVTSPDLTNDNDWVTLEGIIFYAGF